MNQPTISEQIVGAWSLVSYEVRAADEIVQHPLGADAVGLLIYGPHRHMTVQIMASDRQRLRAVVGGSSPSSGIAKGLQMRVRRLSCACGVACCGRSA
jgi:hypothetical protein